MISIQTIQRPHYYKQTFPKVQKLPRLVGIHLEILLPQLLKMPGLWEWIAHQKTLLTDYFEILGNSYWYHGFVFAMLEQILGHHTDRQVLNHWAPLQLSSNLYHTFWGNILRPNITHIPILLTDYFHVILGSKEKVEVKQDCNKGVLETGQYHIQLSFIFMLS